ncbi:MAG TPA: hypothetical protein VGM85_03680, partial [Paraburkholderia sp.]
MLKFNCIVNIITGNELRAIRAARDHVLTDCPHAASAMCKKDFPHAVPQKHAWRLEPLPDRF